MRSWLPLLLLAALSGARLRLGSAEGDPLPASLVDLVRNSPVSSVDDLKLLLQHEADAIEEEDDHSIPANQTHGRHVRSIVEFEIAQQAVCRVRTEVMEVTRSMLDRRNANFMLWPPCVEVQRCSGCCNTRLLQCVPTVTSSRYLQVIKIQYINMKPHYEKAIISVEDHLACRCQPSSPNPPALTTPSHPQPPLPRAAHPAPPKPHGSKADLHRNDDLKRNQQLYNSEEQEPASRQWRQGGYTQLVRYTQPRVHSWPSDSRAEHGRTGNPPQVGQGSGHEGSREEGGESHRQSYDDRDSDHRNLRTQYRLNAAQSDGTSLPDPTPSRRSELSPAPVLHSSTNPKDSVTGRPNMEATPAHPRTQADRLTGGGRKDNESANRGEAKDLARANGGGELTEEERRQKVLEVVQGELDRPTHLHPLHPQQRPKPEFATAAPPSNRQTPFRPASPRRRRKHRKRISKAAMRDMIM
ncbi:platelet-derived growth factor beta polypeptide a [Vanacampus margaritifer]